MNARRRLLPCLAVLAAGAVVATGWDVAPGADAVQRSSTPRTLLSPVPGPLDGTVTVGQGPGGRVIPSDFVGLSIEYPALEAYAGAPGQPVNPLFVRLVRALAKRPVLRIGGDSGDATWWPEPGRPTPPSVSFTLTPQWLARLRAVSEAADARLILGVNLKVGVPALSLAEANALRSGVDSTSLEALEIGNEPSNYSRFAAWRVDGQPYYARPPSYDFASYLREFDRLRRSLPDVPLAGPALGSTSWLRHLRRFIATQHRVRMITAHRYPLSCFSPPGTPTYPSPTNLLAQAAADGLAKAIRPYVAEAHAAHDTFRLDELNSVSCGGRAGVSDSFAAALWLVDSLFEVAEAGVDGVNIHTFPGARYAPFSFTQANAGWAVHVAMPYLGLLMFTRAAPAGARLLPTRSSLARVQAWATRTPGGGERIVLINERPHRSTTVAVQLGGGAARTGQLQWLIAPSSGATSGARLDGQSFADPSFSARLTGTPDRITLAPRGGRYVVTLPPASALLLSLGG